MVGLRDQLHKKELVLEERAGWSYPRSKSGETRSYSCRRLPFWIDGSPGGPVLLAPRLEGEQTATEARFGAMQTMESAATGSAQEYDHQMHNMESVSHLSTCAALHYELRCACKSSSPTSSPGLLLPGLARLHLAREVRSSTASHRNANGSSALVTFAPAPMQRKVSTGPFWKPDWETLFLQFGGVARRG